MTFTILPAEKGDLPALAEVSNEAFATDPAFGIIYGNCDMKEAIKCDVACYEQEYDTPGRRFFKLVDDENGYVYVPRDYSNVTFYSSLRESLFLPGKINFSGPC